MFFSAPACSNSKNAELVAGFVGHAVGGPGGAEDELDLGSFDPLNFLQGHFRLLDDLRTGGTGRARQRHFDFYGLFFLLDAVHEHILPLKGYTTQRECSSSDLLRRSREGV